MSLVAHFGYSLHCSVVVIGSVVNEREHRSDRDFRYLGAVLVTVLCLGFQLHTGRNLEPVEGYEQQVDVWFLAS